MPKEKEKKNKSFLQLVGKYIVIFSCVALLVIFYPVITAELEYILSNPLKDEKSVVIPSDDIVSKKKYIVPVDSEFGLIIPKINVNTPVIKNVDSQNPSEYQEALSKGVAHAKSSSLPDKIGNTFIFSHSSVDFLTAKMFNSILYLLHKLKIEDNFYVSYENNLYKYVVTEVKKVSKNDVQYMSKDSHNRQVTLMTCWPPGTDIKRLVVIGNLESIN